MDKVELDYSLLTSGSSKLSSLQGTEKNTKKESVHHNRLFFVWKIEIKNYVLFFGGHWNEFQFQLHS